MEAQVNKKIGDIRIQELSDLGNSVILVTRYVGDIRHRRLSA
jgi:hypothetical protein